MIQLVRLYYYILSSNKHLRHCKLVEHHKPRKLDWVSFDLWESIIMDRHDGGRFDPSTCSHSIIESHRIVSSYRQKCTFDRSSYFSYELEVLGESSITCVIDFFASDRDDHPWWGSGESAIHDGSVVYCRSEHNFIWVRYIWSSDS